MISNFHRDALPFVVGVALLCCGPALAERPDLEVRVASANQVEVEPGSTLTLTVVVENKSGELLEIQDHLHLPSGCQNVLPLDGGFRLEAEEQSVRILAVRVSSAMPAGPLEIGYTARNLTRADANGRASISVQVQAISRLELTVESRSERVLAGDAYPVKLWATNRGNSPLDVRLRYRSSLAFEVQPDTERFRLGPGESRAIACEVRTLRSFDRHTRHAVTFELEAVSESGRVLTASQASVAEIIPLVSNTNDPIHRLPMQIRQIGIAQRGDSVRFQTEVSGHGSLDEAGERQVDFLFRGPGIESATFFGSREQYGASYSDRRWEFALGDRVYSLSPLTEKRSFGRGMSISWNGEKTAVGGFYMATRYRSQNAEEWGGFFRRAVSDNVSLQANFLRKSGGGRLSRPTKPQEIVTLESSFRLGERHNLRIEAGFGSRVGEGGGHSAYRIDARGSWPGSLSYAIEHAHAGPNFHGYFSDTETTFASIAKRLTDRLRAHASVNRHAANLALNDVRSSVVNRENSWRAGVSFAQSEVTELSLEWQHIERADILEPVAYDFAEDAVRVGIGRKFGALYAHSYVDFGTLDNTVTGERGAFRRYGSSINWRPGARQNYSVNGSYGPSAYTGSMDTTLSAGVSANWQLSENLNARLSYTRNKFDGLVGRELDQSLASLSYQFKNKSSLSLVSRWSSMTTDAQSTARQGDDAAAMVSYTIPFGAPLARKRSIGALRGRLIDETRNSGSGLDRVVVQVGGQYAVTDETGQFEFPSLAPGVYELEILQDSLGPQMAMRTPLPMKVAVQPAKTSEISLSAAPASSIEVRVKRYAFADGDAVNTSGALREACGEEAVAVEISNGHEIWRAQTDRTGFASFDRLSGGRWVLRLASGDLPPLHVIEDPARAVSLEPGERQQVAVRVLPKRRTLRLLDSGEVRAEVVKADGGSR